MKCCNCNRTIPEFLVKDYLARKQMCKCFRYCRPEVAKKVLDIAKTTEEAIRTHALSDQQEKSGKWIKDKHNTF